MYFSLLVHANKWKLVVKWYQYLYGDKNLTGQNILEAKILTFFQNLTRYWSILKLQVIISYWRTQRPICHVSSKWCTWNDFLNMLFWILPIHTLVFFLFWVQRWMAHYFSLLCLMSWTTVLAMQKMSRSLFPFHFSSA